MAQALDVLGATQRAGLIGAGRLADAFRESKRRQPSIPGPATRENGLNPTAAFTFINLCKLPAIYPAPIERGSKVLV